jgi:hypothetical protein
MSKKESYVVLALIAFAGVVWFFNSRGCTTCGATSSGDPLASPSQALTALPQYPAINFPVAQATGETPTIYNYNFDASRIDEPAGDTEFLTGFSG